MKKDESVKKRLRKAKKSASIRYKDLGYKIINNDNEIICFSAIRFVEIRMVRVVVDDISDHDKAIMEALEVPKYCTRELMCRPFRAHRFKHLEYHPKKGWQEITVPKLG